jgi:ABC-2 type transport system permease protein
MWTRLVAFVVKELLVVLRDPKSRFILVVPPLVQLVVFTFAATLEVKNVDVVGLNRDEGAAGVELVRRIEGSPTFRTVVPVHHPSELRATLDQERAIAAIDVGPNFSRDLVAGRPASVWRARRTSSRETGSTRTLRSGGSRCRGSSRSSLN